MIFKGSVWQLPNRPHVETTVSAWRPDERPGLARPLAVAAPGPDREFVLVIDDTELGAEAEIVLRVHYGRWRPESGPGPLAAVLQVPLAQDSLRPVQIWVTPPPDRKRVLFLRAVDESGRPLRAETMHVVGPGRPAVMNKVMLGRGGWFAATRPIDPEVFAARFWAAGETTTLVCEREFGKDEQEAELVFGVARSFSTSGRLLDTTTDAGLSGARVELLDRAGNWPNPVVTTTTDQSGVFEARFGRGLDEPPEPTFVIWYGDVRVAVAEWPPDWKGDQLNDVRIALTVDREQALTYRIDGQALSREDRHGVPDLDIELWSREPARLLRVAVTDASGRFSASVRSTVTAGPPAVDVRVMQAGRILGSRPVEPRDWVDGAATVSVVVEPIPKAPPTYRVTGRVLHNITRAGIGGIRVEAWDMTPRSGGLVGAATYTVDDGTFELTLPSGPAPGRPPTLYFTLYSGESAIPVAQPPISWDDAGLTSTVIEIAGHPDRDGEVVLHELGETIATAVQRMQVELQRYPSELGAYVIDELDLSVPVAVQLDRLGQVRARVVDRAPADEQLGHFRMRVRPVTGTTTPPSEQLDQALSILPELTPEAIEKLAAVRIFSVEDLARRAQSTAGREALTALGLGVDLSTLLGKVAVLAVRVVPRPIREALLALGIGDLKSFTDADPVTLAELLSKEVAQTITADAVAVWQRQVAELLRIPLPPASADEER